MLAHKHTRAELEASAARRIDIYTNITQRRLETQLNEQRKINEGLMRDKILLNGRIAILQATLENMQNERGILQEHILEEEDKINRLFKVVTESPLKVAPERSSSL